MSVQSVQESKFSGAWRRPGVPAEFSTMRYYLFRLSQVNSLEDTIIDAAGHQPLPPGKVYGFTLLSFVRCPFGVRPSGTRRHLLLKDISLPGYRESVSSNSTG